jgi:hypothetical protein
MSGNNNIIIQPRDLHLLRTVARLRAIDREQAKTAGGFTSVTRVNATLLRLVRAKLLNRFFLGIGPGTQKAIYTISPKGAVLAAVPYRRFRRKDDALYSGDLFLEHQLLLNDIYFSTQQPQPQVTVQNWQTFDRPLPESAVIPDAYCEIVFNNLIRPVFLEVDKSTESKKIWKKKTASYLSFALSGAFEREFHRPQFRVAVITTTEQQLRRIQAAVLEQTSKVFWLATFNDIKHSGFFSTIWRRPNSSEKCPFL